MFTTLKTFIRKLFIETTKPSYSVVTVPVKKEPVTAQIGEPAIKPVLLIEQPVNNVEVILPKKKKTSSKKKKK